MKGRACWMRNRHEIFDFGLSFDIHIISIVLPTTHQQGPRTETSEHNRQRALLCIVILCIIEDYVCIDVITEDEFDRCQRLLLCFPLQSLEREREREIQ